MKIEAPRDDLFRMLNNADELRFGGEDGNTLVGYGAVFNEPTRIDSWEGTFDEVIAPGAFRKTIAERGAAVKVLYDHGFDPSIGNKPIATVETLEEDDNGLMLRAEFIDRPYAEDIKAAVEAGAIDGMSFRFNVVKDEWDESGDVPLRTLREVKLLELGPVTFPAYSATTAGVRSQAVYETFVRDGVIVDQVEPSADTPVEDEPPVGTRPNTRKAVLERKINRFLKEHK